MSSPTNPVMNAATLVAADTVAALDDFTNFISACSLPNCTIADTPGLTPAIQDFYDTFVIGWASANR